MPRKKEQQTYSEASSSASRSVMDPLLRDMQTPTSDIFDHEVADVPVSSMAYTWSTSSSVNSGSSSNRNAFIPRSILVPPEDLDTLAEGFAEDEGFDVENGEFDGNGIAATNQTTLYPSVHVRERSGSDAFLEDEYETNKRNLSKYRGLLKKHNKLGEIRATAICGNDATGSILYMAGQCVTQAGVLAPICVVIVNIVLFLFRNVYGEAVTSLPLNGGAYNVLLNTTKKATAAIAAVLTLLSYTATAVVSATEAIHYLHHIYDFDKKYMVYIILGLLFFFAVLNFIGIGESASVAVVIFCIHILTMSAMVVYSIVHLSIHGLAQFHVNRHNQDFIQPDYGKAIIYGFAAAMLGVTGFETSANYVEEQKPGVFIKTLRNMWYLCTFFNTQLIAATVSIVDLRSIIEAGTESTIVATLANKLGGDIFEKIVCINACLVLAGGVLTSYVGVTGLMRRLAMDRCLPQFLLVQNEWRGTTHYIIFGFFALCSSMYLLLNGNVTSLSQTYSVAFLTVMGLFALGVMMLKIKRSTLVAQVTSSWISAFIGFACVLTGLGASIARDHQIVFVFFVYFLVAWSFIQVMFFRFQVLKLLTYFAKLMPFDTCRKPTGCISRYLEKTKAEIQDIAMGFFTKNGDISVINKAVLYVRENEDCSWLRIIHCFEDETSIPATLYRDVHMLNNMYPKLKIDLVLVKGRFSPSLVAYISVKLDINRNLLFITTPQLDFEHKLEDLGGVRLITH